MIENIEANFRKFGAVQKQYFSIFDRSIKRELRKILSVSKEKLPKLSDEHYR